MSAMTPTMREARMEQTARLGKATAMLAASLGWDDTAAQVEVAVADIEQRLAAHRAEHGQTVTDKEPVL